MLRATLTAAAALCLSQAAFARDMTAEQRNACMDDYENTAKALRSAADASKESDKLTPACK